MVSTRNAASYTPSTTTKAKLKQKGSAAQAVFSNSSRLRTNNPPADRVQPVEGSRLRKRGRDESVMGGEALPPSGSLVGERSPIAKRVKGPASAEEPSLGSRKRKGPAATNAPEEANAVPQDATLSLGNALDPPNITNYSETIENQNGPPNGGEISMNTPIDFFAKGLELRTQSLPVLDNFATQILSVLAKSSYQDILNIVAIQTGPGQQWSQLIRLFGETKKVYIDNSLFLSAQSLGLSGKHQVDTIKKANMATFVHSLFGVREVVDFEYFNAWFLDIFSVDGTRMLKPHAQLFLDLKTQGYISAATKDKAAIVRGQRDTRDILDGLFPSNLDQYLLYRRNGAAQLTIVERQFVEQARIRSKALLEESQSEEEIDKLPSMYPWQDFLRAIQSYVKTNFDDLVGKSTSTVRRPGRPRQEQNVFRASYGNQDLQSHVFTRQGGLQIDSAPSSSNDIAEKAARAAHFAMETFSNEAGPNLPSQSPSQHRQNDQAPSQQQSDTSQTSGPPLQFHFERPLHPNVPSPPAPFFTQIPYQNGQMQGQWHPRSSGGGQLQSYESEGVIPYPTQSAPTHVLYERARQVASTKSSQQQTPRKTSTSTPTQRRPWTPDEENALMAGLDRVKGPHWSQIHAMFGPGGTINDVLKDRNQVQLKDKARNLKLFFLKSNIEVPYYLQFVTGELKTRAPSRAAKNEARQKAMSEEDRAHVQGVMTLAGTTNTGEVNLDDPEGEETEQQNMLRLAVSATNDVNIDPALEVQLRQASAETAEPSLSGGRYTVPTPNMLMQNIEKFIGGSNAAESSKR